MNESWIAEIRGPFVASRFIVAGRITGRRTATPPMLLWELRVPANLQSGPSELDATNVACAMYGCVSYFHAGGIDKPLLITKVGAESVVPRDTWRGQFHAGTSPVTGAVRDCPIGVQTNCLQVNWPGWNTSASHAWGEGGPDIRVWYGGLVDGMRDASGQMYMRNRYYDPATGQFTQTDPIGLAGGLNAYGFAAGDPVSYSDPYGLCPDHLWDKETQTCPGNMSHAEYDTVQAAIATLRPGREQSRLHDMLETGLIRKVDRTAAGRPAEAEAYYGRIEITNGFFTGQQPGYTTGYNTAGERGWVLGHEFGHIVQWESGRLIRDIGNPRVRRSRRRMLRLFNDQQRQENPILQGDADLMGCMLATQPGIWQANCGG